MTSKMALLTRFLRAARDSSEYIDSIVTSGIERRESEDMGWVSGYDNKLWVDKNEHVGKRLANSTEHEPALAEFIKKQTSTGNVCFDVGCQWGTFSLLMADSVGDTGKVISVDPVDRHIEALRKSAHANGFDNISVHRTALTNKNGTVSVHTHSKNTGASRLSRDSIWHGRGEPVSAYTLDSFCEQEIVDEIDLLKLDVEGAELDVLEGAAQMLDSIEVLIIEVHSTILDDNELESMLKILHECGTVKTISGEHVTNIGMLKTDEHIIVK